MRRLIDAESLKKAIYKWIPKAPEDLLKNEIQLIENLIVSMMMTIDEQPTIDAEPHWIPCSERLPEVRQWVLCQCRAGIMDVLRLTEDGSWYKGYPNAEYMGGFVVAWMPMPKPYEENYD